MVWDQPFLFWSCSFYLYEWCIDFKSTDPAATVIRDPASTCSARRTTACKIMSERGLADEQQAKSGKILKAELGGSIPRKTVEVTELEVPSCRPSHSLYIYFFRFNIYWFVSEGWTMKLQSWRITQQSKRIEVLSMRVNILPYSTQVLWKQ